MSRCLFERLLVLIVHLINTLRLFIPCGAGEFSFLHRDLADVHPVIRFIGNPFRKDILRALQRFLCIRCAFFRIHISSSCFFQRTGKFLFPDQLSKAIQTLFLCDTCSRLPLWTVWAIQVFYHNQCFCRQNFIFQIVRQLALFFNVCDNGGLFLLQIAQIIQTLIQISQYLIV